MPFQATGDVTVPRLIGKRVTSEGEEVGSYEAVTYSHGAVVFEADIAPHILSRLDDGDDHLSSLLVYIDENEARDILAQQGKEREPVGSGGIGEIQHLEDQQGGESGPAVGPQFEQAEEAKSGDVGTPVGNTAQPEGSVATDPEDVPPPQEGQHSEPESEQPGGEEAESGGDGSTGDQNEGDGDSPDGPPLDEEQEGSEEDPLDSMSKTALRERAKELEIGGRTTMDEDELRQAIREAEAQ